MAACPLTWWLTTFNIHTESARTPWPTDHSLGLCIVYEEEKRNMANTPAI